MDLNCHYNTMQYYDMRRILYMIASPNYKYILKTDMVTDFGRNTQSF